MHLVQLLLPLRDNGGRVFRREEFERVRAELAERFGGVTAYTRSPAEGLWKDGEGGVTRDSVVAFEVLVESLDRAWWAAYRDALAARFRQEELLITASAVERL
jgi:hypothetical protein